VGEALAETAGGVESAKRRRPRLAAKSGTADAAAPTSSPRRPKRRCASVAATVGAGVSSEAGDDGS
jgi:hypothetical protein